MEGSNIVIVWLDSCCCCCFYLLILIVFFGRLALLLLLLLLLYVYFLSGWRFYCYCYFSLSTCQVGAVGCALGCSPLAKLLPLKIKVWFLKSFWLQIFLKPYSNFAKGLLGLGIGLGLKALLGEIQLYYLKGLYETDMDKEFIWELLELGLS